jgi:hypothetical protein
MRALPVDLAEATKAFEALTAEQQLRFLAFFGHNLTVAARDTYVFQAPGVRAPQRLRAINEIQHRVFGHLRALLNEGEWRYPGDAFVGILLDHEDDHLRAQAVWCFEDALKRVRESQ